MACKVYQFPDGGKAIVCGSKKALPPACSTCGRPCSILCDFPVAKGKTCDKPACETHSKQVGPDAHFCEQHKNAKPVFGGAL